MKSVLAGENCPYLDFSEYLQRIRDLEDKTEIQRRQIKDLEEKVGHV